MPMVKRSKTLIVDFELDFEFDVDFEVDRLFVTETSSHRIADGWSALAAPDCVRRSIVQPPSGFYKVREPGAISVSRSSSRRFPTTDDRREPPRTVRDG